MPARKVPHVEKACKGCGAAMRGRPCDLRAVYCSQSCQQSGPRNSNYKHGKSQTPKYIRDINRASYQRRKVKCATYRHTRRARLRNADGQYSPSDVAVMLKRQQQRCALCRRSIRKRYEIDHILPLSRGGSNWPSNIQLLCPTCNRRKHDRTNEEFAPTLGLLL